MLTKGEWSAWHLLKGDIKVEFSGIYLTLSRNVYTTHNKSILLSLLLLNAQGH